METNVEKLKFKQQCRLLAFEYAFKNSLILSDPASILITAEKYYKWLIEAK